MKKKIKLMVKVFHHQLLFVRLVDLDDKRLVIELGLINVVGNCKRNTLTMGVGDDFYKLFYCINNRTGRSRLFNCLSDI